MTSFSDTGASLVESLLTLSILAMVSAMGVPVVGAARDALREKQACQWLASHLRSTRQQALLAGRRTAVLFDVDHNGEWGLRTCADGNGDGVSRADIDRGLDTCTHPSWPLAAWVPGAAIDRRADVPDPSGNYSLPVAFGTARQVTFSPSGTSSSGTATVRTRGGRHCAVRVAGVTGRVRVVTFDPRTRQWSSTP